jgi:DNA-binding MarR family transcriptional regulator
MDASDLSVLTTWSILDQTYTLLYKHLDKVMGQGGSSAAMASALFALKQAGRPMPMSRLARIVVQEPQSLTSLADRLETAGLLGGAPRTGSDRRVVNVFLTLKGEQLAERLSASAREALAENLAVLRPRELEALTRTLKTLRKRGADILEFPLMPYEEVGHRDGDLSGNERHRHPRAADSAYPEYGLGSGDARP